MSNNLPVHRDNAVVRSSPDSDGSIDAQGLAVAWGDITPQEAEGVVAVHVSYQEWHVMVEALEFCIKSGPRQRNTSNLAALVQRLRSAAPDWVYNSGQGRWGNH